VVCLHFKCHLCNAFITSILNLPSYLIKFLYDQVSFEMEFLIFTCPSKELGKLIFSPKRTSNANLDIQNLFERFFEWRFEPFFQISKPCDFSFGTFVLIQEFMDLVFYSMYIVHTP